MKAADRKSCTRFARIKLHAVADRVLRIRLQSLTQEPR